MAGTIALEDVLGVAPLTEALRVTTSGIPDPLPPMPVRIKKNLELMRYRDKRIWELKKAGKSYKEIHRIIGDDISYTRLIGVYYEQEKLHRRVVEEMARQQENNDDQHEHELRDVAGEAGVPDADAGGE